MFSKKLLSKIALLSFPVVLSNLLQTSITIADTIMVGRLGPMEIAAVGLGNTARLLLFVTVMSVAGGAMSLIAQAKGSRDKNRMSLVTVQSLVSGLVLSVLLGAIGYFLAEDIIRFMESAGNEETILLSTEYLQYIFLGSPFLLINFIQNRLMQGAGDTFTPLVLTVILAIMNVIFNYVFIFGFGAIPGFGVVGAAFGTLLARALMAIFGIWLFYSGKNVIHILQESWKPNWTIIKDILNIGVPSGIQGFFRHFGNVIIIKLVTATQLGTLGAAAFAIGMQAEMFALQPALGINVAGTSLIGQEIGRWQVSKAFRNGNVLIILAVLVMCIFILPFIIWPEQIIHLFEPSANESVLTSTKAYFRTNIFILPLYAIGIVITGTMRGAGNTRPAMISSILGRNILTIFFAWYLAFPMGMDFQGIWMGMVIGKLFDCTFMFIAWYRRKWLLVALKKTEIYRTHLKDFSMDMLRKYLKEVRTPQMAIAGTLESIKEHQVLYINESQQTKVTFTKNEFKVETKPFNF